jgi:hypothetical protein
MLTPFKIGNHPTRSVVSGRSGYPAARVGAGTTQVKILNRGSILGSLWVWPQRKKLIHIVTPVKNI